MYSDPVRIEQIMCHFVRVSIARARPNSSLLLRALLHAEGHSVRLEVCDEFTGVSQQQIEELIKEEEGEGWAMHLCKELAQHIPGGGVGVQYDHVSTAFWLQFHFEPNNVTPASTGVSPLPPSRHMEQAEEKHNSRPPSPQHHARKHSIADASSKSGALGSVHAEAVRVHDAMLATMNRGRRRSMQTQQGSTGDSDASHDHNEPGVVAHYHRTLVKAQQQQSNAAAYFVTLRLPYFSLM